MPLAPPKEHVMNDIKRSPVLDAFQSYTRAFQSLDPKAAAAAFHEPAVMITPRGVEVLPDRAAVERAYKRVMAELPAMQYAGTKFEHIGERRLGDDLAQVTGSGTWMNAAGKEFMPFGMTYTFRKNGQSWRIVVAAIHDANAAP
jgi:ketosteroid isomerase-like protein